MPALCRPLLYLLALLLTGFTCRPEAASRQRPNIILILADDLGYETIGANGGTSYQTPNIDALAAGGMRFEHTYAQPLCTPSRIQLMTGICNIRNYVNFGLLEPHQVTFAHLLQSAGYATAIAGKWQLGKDPMSPRRAGFDKHCLWQVQLGRADSTGRDTRFSQPVLEIDGRIRTYADTAYGPRIVADYALDFIEDAAGAGKPFLLYYSMMLTHCPFSPTPDSPEWMADRTAVMSYKGRPQYFGDMMAYMDKLVGRIHRKLEALGIGKNTLVLFTGDNGTDVPIVSQWNGQAVAGAKGQTTDAGTRVPLIAYWPEQVRGGSVCRDLVDFTDFLPTLCQAAGITVPDSLQIDGRSFLPQLLGRPAQPREWIYSWYSRDGEQEKARIFARNLRYKLYDTGEFYDVPADPLEQQPIPSADLDSETQAIYDRLTAVLVSYRRRRLEAVPGKDFSPR